ncbi:MAG TPA: ATP-binding protein [Solirubrobacterales bacterium]|nr:ATP-binding protein [Solirubrobacterales bacterium]
MTELAEIVAGWPLAASIAAAATARGLRAGRRRTALNEALHELRRPLHSIALATGPGSGPRVESSVRLAAMALERLDCEINGGAPSRAREVLAVRSLLESTVGRWKARASLGCGSLTLRWRAGEALVEADRFELAQALDNLIVNAIEHGGPSIAVEAGVRGERLRVSVVDSGRASRPDSRRGTPAEVIARLAGRRRHGHGLAVVRRVAAAHRGRFALRRSEDGTVAVLELPLAKDPSGSAA